MDFMNRLFRGKKSQPVDAAPRPEVAKPDAAQLALEEAWFRKSPEDIRANKENVARTETDAEAERIARAERAKSAALRAAEVRAQIQNVDVDPEMETERKEAA